MSKTDKAFMIVPKTESSPFALSLSKGRSWFDKPVLSGAEGLTTNGILNVSCSNDGVFVHRGADCNRHSRFLEDRRQNAVLDLGWGDGILVHELLRLDNSNPPLFTQSSLRACADSARHAT